MLRWYLIPRNRWLNVYLHKILRDDDDRALHDHPWRSFSIYLRGSVREIFDESASFIPPKVRVVSAPNFVYRSERFRHRLELIGGRACWTLFITGPRLREWGFWCPKGFVVWTDFVDQEDQGNVGRGCGEKS